MVAKKATSKTNNIFVFKTYSSLIQPLLQQVTSLNCNFPQKIGGNACLTHSNDSHQCPILAADFVIFYYGTENEEAIQAGAGSE